MLLEAWPLSCAGHACQHTGHLAVCTLATEEPSMEASEMGSTHVPGLMLCLRAADR